MLQKLYIRNYAIIDELTICFDPKLNVITGETGAGKSIIMGALALILGDRADTSILINREEKCIVEAVFQSEKNPALNDLLKANDLDLDHVTIIRREITTNGKSRAFVNDTPVNLQTLNTITAHLVDLHRQFDNYALKDRQFMYEVIDSVSENQALLRDYQLSFDRFKRLEHEIAEAVEKQRLWQQEADYKQFLFEELEAAAFVEGEIENLERLVKQQSNAEQIKTSLNAVYGVLEEDDLAINMLLRRAIQQLADISEVHAEAGSLAERLESVLIELRDIADESKSQEQKLDFDVDDLNSAQERIDLSYRLLKKHQVQTTSELLEIKEKLEADLSLQAHADEHIEALRKKAVQTRSELKKRADEIHANRARQAPLFSAEVNKMLHLIGMPNATLKIELRQKETFDEFGTDEVSFLWDANKSGNFQALQKSASGGELSRIMLCIKTLTAKAMALPTLIFDEVDTGISGEAARQVGLLLRSLGESHQVMSITHQPQIAAKGTAHFYVYKTAESDKVNTRIRQLRQEERVKVLAEMIGGDQPSEAAMNNAKELMES